MEKNDISHALSVINFRSLLPLFHSIGIPPNESEDKCAIFAFDIATAPFVDPLRSEDAAANVLPTLRELIVSLLEAAHVSFGSEPKMKRYSQVLESLRGVVDDSLCASDRLSVPPSTLKAALHRLQTLPPPASPLALAMEFGQTGKDIIKICKAHIGAGARDQVGMPKFKSAAEQLHELAAEASDCEDAKISKVVQDICSAFNLCAKSTQEELQTSLAKVFKDLHTIISMKAAGAMSKVRSTLWPVMLDFMESLEASPSSDMAQPPAADVTGENAAIDPEQSARATTSASEQLEAMLDKWREEAPSTLR